MLMVEFDGLESWILDASLTGASINIIIHDLTEK